MKKKILMYGISTFKNRGVEAIINSSIKQIDKKKYDIELASYDLEYNSKFYNDRVTYINHNKKNNLSDEEKALELKYQKMPFDYNNFELLYQGDVVKAIEKADICISVGGDNYCYNPCSWLYALDNKSYQSNKKTVLWGCSLFEKIDDLELIDNLKKFDVVVIRESLTLNAIKDYVDPEKIIFARDPAFSLKPKKVKLSPWYKNRKYIILNASLLTIKNEDNYKELIDFMNYILKETKYSICLLPHVTTPDCNDIEILSKLKKEFKKDSRVYLEENNYDCTELKYIISKSQITVAARTHASIAAYSTCIPTLVIGYSVKSKGIAKDLFNSIDEYVINSSDMHSGNLIKKFKYIDENKEEIRNVLSKQMPSIKEEASHIFEKVIKKIEEQEITTICKKEKCIGCGLCSSVCPVDAISMEANKEGYIYPKIDIEKCIHCNKCRKLCPILNEKEENQYEKKIYAVKNKNEKERCSSSSGGAFSIIAKNILSKKGIVYGCELKNNKAEHIRIEQAEDLEKIRGSKYIQSNIIDTFKSIQKDLENNKAVLFSGTPCQVGAIKSLFGDKENLYTISVVCHGVLNDKLLRKHIESLEKINNALLLDWTFRCKETNSWTQSSVSYRLNGNKIVSGFMNDNLMYLYLKNMILRESCYDCKYKDKKNVADIILADYWGIEVTMPDFFDNKGVSAIITNSPKGEELIKKSKFEKYAEVANGDYDSFIKYNPSYIKSVNKSLLRNVSLLPLDEIPFNILADTLKLKIIQYEYEETKRELNNLRLENTELSNKLDSIYNSTRWKVIDKPFNVINKIIGRQ